MAILLEYSMLSLNPYPLSKSIRTPQCLNDSLKKLLGHNRRHSIAYLFTSSPLVELVFQREALNAGQFTICEISGPSWMQMVTIASDCVLEW